MQITRLIPAVITSKAARQILLVQKHSPRILFVAGIAGAVTSTVLACRATLKVSDVIEETSTTIDGIKNDLRQTDSYYSDMAWVYGKSALDITRLYAPALVLGSLSIGALTGSHVTLSHRNAGITAAYAAVSKAYDEYRDRVKVAIGVDKERDIYHAVSVQNIVDDNGKKHQLTVADPSRWSPYARFFDAASPRWVKNAEINRIFLQAQQNYANDLLRSRHHVFLNEVYEMLGLDHSQAGQVVGWVMGHGGDNYIDFGMFEASNADFLAGWEKNILLDFNVDGVILDLI
jgi:hypothetical protein